MVDIRESNPILHVDRNGHHLSLPAELGQLVRILNGVHVDAQIDSDHGYRASRQYDSLICPQDGMRRANAGLLPAIRHLARREGIEVREACESRCLALPEPVADPRIIDTTLAPYLSSRDRGVIRLGQSVGIANVIAQVAAAYPGARIAVLGSHRPQLDAIQARLREWLATQMVVRCIPADDEGAWVGFSTFTGAAIGDLEKCHLVLLLDATHATHQHAEPALATMDARFRLFGLLRENRRLSPTERDVLMATYGPAVLDIPRHGKEVAQVNLARVTVHRPRVADTDLNPVTIHRRAYWQHPARNRIIARLAMALRTRDRAMLNAHADIAQWMTDHPDRPPRVTVLVGTIEHAVSLGAQMPGWHIAVGASPYEPVDTTGLSGQKRRLLQERRTVWLVGEQQIVTQFAALSGQPNTPDVVIWAGGGPHAPEIPRQWLLHPTGSGGRLLLIDFVDRHGHRLARWSDVRHREYYNRDWCDMWVSAELGRVIRFIDDRPRRRRRRRSASQ